VTRQSRQLDRAGVTLLLRNDLSSLAGADARLHEPADAARGATPETLMTSRWVSDESFLRSRQAWLSSVRVRPRLRYPHTSRISSFA
jgi:hypothetical protein